MKRQIQFIILSLFTVLFASCNFAHAQALNKLQTRCPNSSAYQNFTLNGNGNANFTTCSGGQVQINGVPIPNTGTVSGTSGTLPVFGTNNSLSNSFATQTATGFNIFNPSSDNYYFRINRSGGAAGFALSNLLGTRGLSADTTNLTLRYDNALLFNTPASNSFGRIDNTTNTFLFSNQSGSSYASFNVSTPQFILQSNELILGDLDGFGNSSNFSINDTAQTIRASVNSFEISRNFAVADSSDCVGSGLLNGGGTVDVVLSQCEIASAVNTIILTSYNDVNENPTIPLSATPIDNVTFSVKGSPSGRFNYWIINRSVF